MNDAHAFGVALRRRRGTARHRLAVEGLSSVCALIRSQAADALGDRGASEHVAALARALRDRSHLVRSSAAEALGSVGDVRAVKVLREALADRSALVRGAAALSLGLLGRGRVELRRQLETERRAHVRLCIQVALVDLGERVSLDGVLLFLGHRDYRVRCATANLLAGLGRGALHPSDHPRIIEAMKRRLRIERTVAARSSIRSALAELRR